MLCVVHRLHISGEFDSDVENEIDRFGEKDRGNDREREKERERERERKR